MRCLDHELSEEVHPWLEIDVGFGIPRAGEIIHAGCERSLRLVDTVLPFKQQHISIISLSAQEPIVPFLYFAPILCRKIDGGESIRPPEVLECQDESGRVAVLDVLLHKSRTTAKFLSLLASVLLSWDPPIIEHSIKPALDDLKCQCLVFSNANFAVEAIVPKEPPRKALAGRREAEQSLWKIRNCYEVVLNLQITVLIWKSFVDFLDCSIGTVRVLDYLFGLQWSKCLKIDSFFKLNKLLEI